MNELFNIFIEGEEVFYTPSGRKIYRHPNNEGSVIEFRMYGKLVKLFVADAKYRLWTTSSSAFPNSSVVNLFGQNNKFIFPTNSLGEKISSFSDDFIDVNLTYTNGCASAKQNCDLVPNTQNVIYTRSITILDSNGLDVPNVYELFVMMAEGDILDSLDPTVNANSNIGWNKEKGSRWFSNYDTNWWGVLSCNTATHGTNTYVSTVRRDGRVATSVVGHQVMICPIKELL